MFTLGLTGEVATITIDRGAKANAVPIDQWGELEKLVGKANIGPASAIVIRSASRRDFCAGSDLGELDRLSSDATLRRRFRGAMKSVFARIRAVNKPTIAVVDGRCMGTGLSIAMACDIRVCGPDATFGLTPAQFGISYPKEDVERLERLVGFGQAARLLYSSRSIDGEEAYRIGLVEILDRSPNVGAELIADITDNASSSLATLKASLIGRAGADKRFDDHFETAEFAARLDSYGSKKNAL